MQRMRAAVLAATICAPIAQAQAQPAPSAAGAAAGATVLTLEQAILAAGGAPANAAAVAGVAVARAGRTVAGLRPLPVVQGQVENFAGSGAYRGLGSIESTFGVAVPIELGGKRGARVAVAGAQLARAELQAAIVAADVRLAVTRLYIETLAAERRLVAARDQARSAAGLERGAAIRLAEGRVSPLDRQRAEVARLTADARVERLTRLVDAARANLARRIGRPVGPELDAALLDRIPARSVGPVAPPRAVGTLALAAADADLAIADAGVRLARAGRVPDINVGPAVRRLEATNDTAAVFAIAIPIPMFGAGRAAVAQAQAVRSHAEAARRVTALDIEQAIDDAMVEAENAAITARMEGGPVLAAATEAVRVARIGYANGKFGQLDLLDAERVAAEARIAAVDALAAYHDARARLDRLTAPLPDPQGN